MRVRGKTQWGGYKGAKQMTITCELCGYKRKPGEAEWVWEYEEGGRYWLCYMCNTRCNECNPPRAYSIPLLRSP